MWMSRASKNASRARYAASQRTVHWVTAALVAVMLPMGFYMVHRYAATSYDAVTVQIYDVHKLLGFIVLWLVAVRLALRLRHGSPPHDPTIWRGQLAAANVVHALLYMLLILVPVLGWIGASVDGTRSMWGGFQLPEIAAKNEEIGWRILWWHGWAAIALAILATLHVTAALYDHIVRKDGVLRRML